MESNVSSHILTTFDPLRLSLVILMASGCKYGYDPHSSLTLVSVISIQLVYLGRVVGSFVVLGPEQVNILALCFGL